MWGDMVRVLLVNSLFLSVLSNAEGTALFQDDSRRTPTICSWTCICAE